MSTIVSSATRWRKSSYSNDDTNRAQCVELADLGSVVGVRDSKQPVSPVLEVGRGELSALVASVKSGRYDL